MLTSSCLLASWVLLVLLATAQTSSLTKGVCCETKTVGPHNYTKVGHAAVPDHCLNDCVYTRSGQPGARFCFSKGEEEVHCLDNSCTTQGCQEAGEELARSMDTGVDPCDDFYQFSCGGFLQKTSIPEDEPGVTRFTLINDKIRDQVQVLLEEAIRTNEPKVYKMAKTFYQACMDTANIEALGLAPLKALLAAMGGWPVMGQGGAWQEEDWSWYDMIYKFRTNGFSTDYFLPISVFQDVKNNSHNIIYLNEPILSFGLFKKTDQSENYLKKGRQSSQVQAIFTYMKDLALLFGSEATSTDREVAETLDFFFKLNSLFLTPDEKRDPFGMYNKMSISDMSKLDPMTPWLDYINTILSKDEAQITSDEFVIVASTRFHTGFGNLIKNTPKRVQANYLMFMIVMDSVDYLPKAAELIQVKLKAALLGQSKIPARWKTCTEAAKGFGRPLSTAVGSMYVKRHYNENNTDKVLEMVAKIRHGILELLEESDWMDGDTKKEARLKAKEMEHIVGMTPELLDVDKLWDSIYAGLEIDSSTFMKNDLNINKHFSDLSYSMLRERAARVDWKRLSTGTLTANAIYIMTSNAIGIPAGIIRDVFFSSDRPEYMNYGAIGIVIGHEITHGFGPKGSQFDWQGNLSDWWLPETKEKFQSLSQCMVSQYGSYAITFKAPDGSVFQIPVNGYNTLGENIADNGGLKLAYRAYNSYVSEHGEEPTLPGLALTQRQLFWVSFASTTCSKWSPQFQMAELQAGVHSPGEIRVLGTFSNMEEFSRDFNCPKGSRMNPEKKCKVW